MLLLTMLRTSAQHSRHTSIATIVHWLELWTGNPEATDSNDQIPLTAI